MAFGQTKEPKTFAIKTNLLSALLGNINAGVEFSINKRDTKSHVDDHNITTLNLPISYNPFTYNNNRKLKHIAFQPELRIWKSKPFEGFFLGIHAHYAYYNIGGIDLPFNIASSLKERRYQGQLFGAGLSAGYDFRWTKHLKIETSVGAGYAHMDNDVYRCVSCGTKLGHEIENYLGPTKASIALVYLIK